MNVLNDECYVVDKDGKIIDTLDSRLSYAKLEAGDKVIRKGVLEYLNETYELNYRYLKLNPIAYQVVCKKCPIISVLICYANYMDNELRYSNGVPLRINTMAKVCEVSESTIKRQLKILMEDDVIHKIKRNNKIVYVINPWLCHRGKHIYLSLYEEFKMSQMRDLVEEFGT